MPGAGKAEKTKISSAFIWETSIKYFYSAAGAALLGAWCLTPGLAGAQTVPVQTASLTPATWRMSVEVAGNVQAAEHATLSPERAGIVTQVYFASGAHVRAGQVLVQLEDAPERATLALDQAKLGQSGRDLARTRKLMAISGSSQSALEQAQAAQAEAAAQVALDQAELAQLQITAPFAGTLGIRALDPGDAVQPGQAVITLAADGPLRVLFAIPQAQSGGLAVGDAFSLQAPDGAGPPLVAPGHVTALSPEIDTSTDARPVEGHLDAQGGILPGMAGMVTIATGAPEPAFAVPASAVNDGAIGAFLYVLNPGGGGAYRLATVYVTIYGTQDGTSYVSAPGLAAGQKIVALGGFKLNDGQSVSLAP